MGPTRVIKRDGTLQKFDQRKIVNALLKSFNDSLGHVPEGVNDMTARVAAQFSGDVAIGDLETAVVNELARSGFMSTADHYTSFRDKRRAVREQRLDPDPRAVSEFVAAGKYGMHREDLAKFESWSDTIERNETMFRKRFPYLELDNVFDLVRGNKVLGSMRGMQFGGAGVFQHNVRMYNCSFTLINRLRVFQEIFYCLLAGCGVGFSVQYRHVEQLPDVMKIDTDRVRHYAVTDDIEGWANSVGELVRSYFVTGDYVEFDYSQIRPKGAKLKSSGGRAPGHLPLKRLHDQIRAQLDECAFRKMRPIEAFDLVCKIAEAVLAGGIRRSSLIAIFSPEDGEMAHAKVPGNYEWSGKNFWRRMANISAGCLKDEPPAREYVERLIKLAKAYGDPGVVWLAHPDCGCNPCAEIGMYPKLTLPNERVKYWPAGTDLGKLFELSLGPSQGVVERAPGQPVLAQHEVDRSLDYDYRAYEVARSTGPTVVSMNSSDAVAIGFYGHDTGFQFCNLCEVNVAACENEAQFLQACHAAATLGTLQATFTKMPYLGPVTERITEREALIGVGLTGMCDRPMIAFDPDVLRRGATIVKQVNARVADQVGIRPSARCTTVKPSGTASLVLGTVGSGIHPHHARRYFRRITESPTSLVAQRFKEVNPHMVETKPDGNWCITFCVKAPDAAETVKQMPASDFMERIFTVYESWVMPGARDEQIIPGLSHNVSCTVVVSEDEWDEVTRRFYDERRRVSAMAFLPRMGDKGIPFMPREEVTTPADEARWQYLIENYRPVDYSVIRETSSRASDPACSGGACELA